MDQCILWEEVAAGCCGGESGEEGKGEGSMIGSEGRKGIWGGDVGMSNVCVCRKRRFRLLMDAASSGRYLIVPDLPVVIICFHEKSE